MAGSKHRVVVVECNDIAPWQAALNEAFDILVIQPSAESLCSVIDEASPDLVLIESDDVNGTFELISCAIETGKATTYPLVFLANSTDLQERLKALNLGCEDLIFKSIHPDELVARCFRIVFDKIANKQLKGQIDLANQAAFQAMTNTSHLGNNIQFFLDSVECSNLDELGMRLFQSTQTYGVKCSLQIRSRYQIKNLEENGMPKELVSTLLFELKDSGRYVDFGARSVMNYGCVSLLVKNMPTDDPDRYGMLKDNIFSLLQGLDSRVKALDNLRFIEEEKTTIIRLVTKMHEVMAQIDEGFLDVMKQSADMVDELGEGIHNLIEYLGLTEEQEKRIEMLMTQAMTKNEQIFSQGLKLDEGFGKMIKKIAELIEDPDQVDVNQIAQLIRD